MNISRYTVEVAAKSHLHAVLDTQEVFSTTINEAMAKAYIQCDGEYVEVYGPSVAKWMRVRLVNEDTGERTKWYTLNALGKVAA